MTTWLLVLGLALLPQTPDRANTRGAAFNHQQMAPRPLSDTALAAGTISVLVRTKGASPEGISAVVLPPTAIDAQGRIVPDQVLAVGKTNAAGRIFFALARHSGKQIRVAVRFGATTRLSMPLTVPSVGGVRLLFLGPGAGAHGRMGKAGAMAGGMPPGGKVTRDPRHLQLAFDARVFWIDQHKVHVGITYCILNRGTVTYHPGEHGLILPVPDGAVDVSVPDRVVGAKADPKGVTLLRAVPPGALGLRISASFVLGYTQADHRVRLRSVLPLVGYSVTLKAYDKVSISGFGLLPPVSLESEHHRMTMREFRSVKQGFPTHAVTFTITGLPVRSRARSWIFAGLTALLILLALGLAVRHTLVTRRANAESKPTGDELAPTAQDPRLTALQQIEVKRVLGLLSEAGADAEADRVLDTPRPSR